MAKPQQSKGDNYICYIYHRDFVSARLQIEISMISETLADVQHLETAVWKLPYMSRQNTWNSQDETYFYTHWKYTINVFNLPFNLWLVSPFIVFCLIMITAIAVSAAKPTRTTMNHHDQPGNRIKSAQSLPLWNELDVVSLVRHTESNEFYFSSDIHICGFSHYLVFLLCCL